MPPLPAAFPKSLHDSNWQFGSEIVSHVHSRLLGGSATAYSSIVSKFDKNRGKGADASVGPSKKPLTEKTFKNIISLIPKGEVHLDDLTSLVGFLGSEAVDQLRQLEKSSPRLCSVFRSSWLEDMGFIARGSDKSSSTSDASLVEAPSHGYLGSRICNALGAARRLFDVFIREGLPVCQQSPTYYSSPGISILLVDRGAITARFLGLGDVVLNEGDLLFYDGAHAHCFLDSSEHQISRIIDISAERDGIGQSLFVRTIPEELAGINASMSGGGIVNNARINLALAIAASSMRVESLADFAGLSTRRLGELGGLTGRPPQIRELEQLGKALREDPSSFLLPFDGSRERMTRSVVSRQEVSETFSRMRSPDYKPTICRRNRFYSSHDWACEIVNPKNTLFRSTYKLAVSAFLVRGPSDGATDYLDHHKDSGGEEVIIGLDGQLGASLRSEPTDSTCSGTLDPGDILWYSTQLKHSFFTPRAGFSSLSLFFWTPDTNKMEPSPADLDRE